MAASAPVPVPPIPGQYVLGYWEIKSLAAVPRMLFAYSGTPVHEVLYKLKQDSETGEWHGDWHPVYKQFQQSHQHEFPNLPFLITPEGHTFVQSHAITRHLARVFDLYGKTEVEKFRADEAVDQLLELRHKFRSWAYRRHNFDEIRHELIHEDFPYYFETLLAAMARRNAQDAAATGKAPSPFVAGGEAPTFADFYLYDIADISNGVTEGRLLKEERYAALREHFTMMRGLPRMQEYFASAAAQLPYNNKSAVFY
jgi:glutathione S-transferase